MPPSTELPPAAWSAEADVGAERRNPVPLSQKSRCLAGRRPAKARRATPNRRRARSNQTARRLPRGFLWPRGDRGTPPVFMKPPSRGAWRCKRGRGRSLPLAVRTNRNAGKRGAPKPCSRPLPDTGTPEPPHWTASVKASRALSQHWLRLRPSRVARRRIAHQHLATPRPPRGPRDADPGARSIASRPRRTGGANPVVARSVTRRTRPSRSSGSGAGRTGRCAGTRPRPGRC